MPISEMSLLGPLQYLLFGFQILSIRNLILTCLFIISMILTIVLVLLTSMVARVLV